jgi:hypothetical protein
MTSDLRSYIPNHTATNVERKGEVGHVFPLPAEVASEELAHAPLTALPQLTLLHQARQAQTSLTGPTTADTNQPITPTAGYKEMLAILADQ